MAQTHNLCDIAKNNGQNGQPAWMIIRGAVYDVTKLLEEHPGGAETLLEYAGKDATKAFNEVGHSTDAIRDLKLYKIGVVSSECQQKTKTDVATGKQQLPLDSGECCRKKKKRCMPFGLFC